MDPITLAIILGVIFSGIGTTIGNWNTIIKAIKGKKIAILGTRGSGKTTLLQYLNMINKDSSDSPSQTTEIQKTRNGSIQVEIGQDSIQHIFFKETKDLPGSEEIRDSNWRDIFIDSQIVLYLINADDLLNKKDSAIEKRIGDDLRNIQAWIKIPKQKQKKVFIIGNHFDRIDENFADGMNIGKYYDQFQKNHIIDNHGRGTTKIIGTLKSRDTMKKIMEQIAKSFEET